MGRRLEEIRLVRRVIGTKHVITSPNVPELHVSHADEAVARSDVQPALEAIARTKDRVAARSRQARLRQVA